MSRLKSRLRRMTGSRQDVKPELAGTTGDSTASTLDSSSMTDHEWRAMNASEHRNDHGMFIRRVIRYPLSHRHGRFPLKELSDCVPSLSGLCVHGDGEAIAVDRLLFFDTETTGLGIGAGNVPFMIGAGYVEQSEFIVEQCLIRNPAEEPAMLAHLQQLMQRKDILVTYNGRTFDWPVVKNRHVLNRTTESGLENPPHLDLLYAARQLWKDTLASCKLSVVESERLGVERADDVPGAMAPVLYFRYLQLGEPELMRGVFEHNEADILSLAALAVHLSHLLDGSFTPDRIGAEELFRLGKWLLRHGREESARLAFAQLEQRSGPGMVHYWEQLAQLYKQTGKWERAHELWCRCVSVLDQQRNGRIDAYIELAKFYEHKQKDAATALRYASAARSMWEKRLVLREHRTAYRETMQELDHRISRLRRKCRAEQPQLAVPPVIQTGRG